MTIFALATASGRAPVAIVRLSGPAAGRCLEALTSGPGPLPAPRLASLRVLRDPDTGAVLDEALVLWFPAPGSYTGEDCVEFHIHGGRAVVAAVLEAVGKMAGVRPAEPGEFTRRAVINGKLDLTRAEAIADLVDAATERQRSQALGQLGGDLNDLYESWSRRITELLARSESAIDFPDEDLPADILAGRRAEISGLIEAMQKHLADGRRAERLRQGLSIAILGAPNVGKSSLLNRLAQRDAAIVSEEAGTTRDVVEVVMDIAGFEVILADTAGLRETAGAIESEGIRRARELAAAADLKLVVVDAVNLAGPGPDIAALVDETALVVANKCDLEELPAEATLEGQPVHAISCRTGAGLDRLMNAIETKLLALWPLAEAGPGPTRARHRSGVVAALAALERALEADLPELENEDLRLASRALGRITGRVDVEDLLDVVFREFCIGK